MLSKHGSSQASKFTFCMELIIPHITLSAMLTLGFCLINTIFLTPNDERIPNSICQLGQMMKQL